MHTPANEGYAIEPLEKVFYRVAAEVVGSAERVHFSYRDLKKGWPATLPEGFSNVVEFDIRTSDPRELERISAYVRERRITTVFGFDLPVRLHAYARFARVA